MIKLLLGVKLIVAVKIFYTWNRSFVTNRHWYVNSIHQLTMINCEKNNDDDDKLMY